MNAAAGYYEDAVAHLDGELTRLRALLRLRVALDRASGRLPARADAMDRGFISGDAVEAVLGAEAPPPPDAALSLFGAEVLRTSEELARFTARSAEVGVVLPLERLVERLRLPRLARDVLVLAIGAELDGGIRQALGYLQNDITRQTVDLELATHLFCETSRARMEARTLLRPDAPLIAAGLIVPPPHFLADDLSILRMPIRPARHVVDLVLGSDGLDPALVAAATLDRVFPRSSLLERLVISAETRTAIERTLSEVSELEARGMPPVVRIVGPEGTGRSTLAAALAQTLGRGLLAVDVRGLPEDEAGALARAFREAQLRDALLLVANADVIPADGLARLGRLLERHAELTVALESTQPLTLDLARPSVQLSTALPSHAERTHIWRQELQKRGLPRHEAADLAGRYRVSAKTIIKALDGVLEAGAEAGGWPRQVALVRERVARASDHRLGTLATRITARGTWNELVLPADTRRQLERLISHFRHRTKIMVDWGFEARLSTGHGISALFQGPPGTGKTLAAGIIAREFDLELYQVDVSRIVSKWIGETEKNLATIFDEAERAQAILLFDEADSLFSKRTEVQSSNDRHANLEVNFLLQRMDSFRGITLLTTNFGKSIDDAFARRMTFRIDFPEPSVAERENLWERLMPARMERAEAFDFEHLARRFEMSGGHIRNAILKAAIEAASDGTGVTMKHLIAAGNMEYRSMGRLLREDL
jgi:AAA+ superfamily predicted ATPase